MYCTICGRPPSLYILSTWVKWQQYEADHSPLSGAKIKNEWSHASISSNVFTAGAQTVRSVLHCLALLATNGCQMSGVGVWVETGGG